MRLGVESGSSYRIVDYSGSPLVYPEGFITALPDAQGVLAQSKPYGEPYRQSKLYATCQSSLTTVVLIVCGRSDSREAVLTLIDMVSDGRKPLAHATMLVAQPVTLPVFTDMSVESGMCQ